MNKERTLKISAVFIAILLTALLCAFMPKLFLMTVSLDEFNKYILSMGNSGVFMLIFFQILQTVVAPIPGEVIQIAGGYVYGLPLGTIYSLIGLIVGSGIAFYFTRLIGGDFIVNLLRKKKLKWMLDIMESRKFEIILFIIFIMPGLPKDFMIYVAGLTTLRPMKFFIILIASRLPWIMASVSVGANINAGNYLLTIIVSIIAIIGFIIGIFYKDKIIKKFTNEKC